MRGFAVFGGLCVAVATSGVCSAAVYTGSLSYPGTGLSVTGQSTGWPAGLSFSWHVTDEDPAAPAGASWRYEYTVNVAMFAPRRVLIEGSGLLQPADIVGVELAHNDIPQLYPMSRVSMGTQTAATANANLPEAVHGILFDQTGSGTGVNEKITIAFYSSAAPGWGDFYSRCDGNGNSAMNAGFTAGDSDPVAPASSGSFEGHILAPVVVPEPSAMALAGLGLGLLGRRQRR